MLVIFSAYGLECALFLVDPNHGFNGLRQGGLGNGVPHGRCHRCAVDRVGGRPGFGAILSRAAAGLPTASLPATGLSAPAGLSAGLSAASADGRGRRSASAHRPADRAEQTAAADAGRAASERSASASRLW